MGQHRRLSTRNQHQIATPVARVALLASLAFVVALLAPGPAAALPATHSTSAKFTVPASNGYTLDVRSEDGQLILLAFREASPVARISDVSQLLPAGGGYSAATYYVPATGGPEAIDADLGALGEIHVSFQPSGQTHVARLNLSNKTKGCNAPRRIVRRLGTFTGRVIFNGENGYTAVDVRAASGSVGTSPYRTSSTKSHTRSREIVSGQAGPDAFLNARDTAAHIFLGASTLGPGVGFYASAAEVLPGGLAIVRTAEAPARGSAFGVDTERHAATLRPPAPFSGSATYSTSTGAPPSWNGSLTVAFPGHTIPLTGPSFEARLMLVK